MSQSSASPSTETILLNDSSPSETSNPPATPPIPALTSTLLPAPFHTTTPIQPPLRATVTPARGTVTITFPNTKGKKQWDNLQPKANLHRGTLASRLSSPIKQRTPHKPLRNPKRDGSTPTAPKIDRAHDTPLDRPLPASTPMAPRGLLTSVSPNGPITSRKLLPERPIPNDTLNVRLVSTPFKAFNPPDRPQKSISNFQTRDEMARARLQPYTDTSHSVEGLKKQVEELKRDLEDVRTRSARTHRKFRESEEAYDDLKHRYERAKADREVEKQARKRVEAARTTVETQLSELKKKHDSEIESMQAKLDKMITRDQLVAAQAEAVQAKQKTVAAVSTGRKWIERCREYEQRAKSAEAGLLVLQAQSDRLESVLNDADTSESSLRRSLLVAKTDVVKERLANQELIGVNNRHLSAAAVKDETIRQQLETISRLEQSIAELTSSSGNKIALLNEEREKQFSELEEQLSMMEQLKNDLDARDAALGAANDARDAANQLVKAAIGDKSAAEAATAHQKERAEWYKSEMQRLQVMVNRQVSNNKFAPRQNGPGHDRESNDVYRRRFLDLEKLLRERDACHKRLMADKEKTIGDLRASLMYRKQRWDAFHARVQSSESSLERERKRVRYLESELQGIRGEPEPLIKRIKMEPVEVDAEVEEGGEGDGGEVILVRGDEACVSTEIVDSEGDTAVSGDIGLTDDGKNDGHSIESLPTNPESCHFMDASPAAETALQESSSAESSLSPTTPPDLASPRTNSVSSSFLAALWRVSTGKKVDDQEEFLPAE